MSKSTDFLQLGPISYKNRVRIRIGKKIGQIEVEQAKNEITRSPHVLPHVHTSYTHIHMLHTRLTRSSHRSHAWAKTQSRSSSGDLGWSVGHLDWWVTSRVGSGWYRVTGHLGLQRDACRCAAGAALLYSAFDACSPPVQIRRSSHLMTRGSPAFSLSSCVEAIWFVINYY